MEQSHFCHLPPSHSLSPLPHSWEPTRHRSLEGLPLRVLPTTLAPES